MSRVESTRVTAQPGAVRSQFCSHPQLYDSFRVTTSRHDSVSYWSRVGSHVATVESSVISHESQSHKETVRVTSHFHDITSLLTSNVQGLVANLDRRLAQHLVLVLMVRVDFASLPFNAFGVRPPTPCLEMSSTPA
jgi:hypothetical protein